MADGVDWTRDGAWLHTPCRRWCISRSELYGGERVYNAWDWLGPPLPEIIETSHDVEDCKAAIYRAISGD